MTAIPPDRRDSARRIGPSSRRRSRATRSGSCSSRRSTVSSRRSRSRRCAFRSSFRWRCGPVSWTSCRSSVACGHDRRGAVRVHQEHPGRDWRRRDARLRSARATVDGGWQHEKSTVLSWGRRRVEIGGPSASLERRRSRSSIDEARLRRGKAPAVCGTGGDNFIQCRSASTFEVYLSMTNRHPTDDAVIRVTLASGTTPFDFVEFPILHGTSFSFSQAAGGSDTDHKIRVTEATSTQSLVEWISAWPGVTRPSGVTSNVTHLVDARTGLGPVRFHAAGRDSAKPQVTTPLWGKSGDL